MRRHRPILVVFLPFVAGCFLTYLFRSINASIAADLSSEFSLNAAELGLLTSAYFLTIAAVQLPIGVWLDRCGPRRVQSVLLPIAAGGAVLFATAQSFPALLLGRLWIDRLADSLTDAREERSAADGERIVLLVTHHMGAEMHPGACLGRVAREGDALSG